MGKKKTTADSSSAMVTFDFANLLGDLHVSNCTIRSDNAPGHGCVTKPRQRSLRRSLKGKPDLAPRSPTTRHLSKKLSSRRSVAQSPTPQSLRDDRAKKSNKSPEPHLSSSMEAKFRSTTSPGSRQNAPKPIRQASIECLQTGNNMCLLDVTRATVRMNKTDAASPKRGKTICRPSTACKRDKVLCLPNGLATIEL